MIRVPEHLFARLLANGQASLAQDIDHVPVVKFFDPCGGATWLITEARPDEPDILFGLCDLGMGFPELGSVRLSELKSVKGRLGIGLERDFFFAPRYPLSVYLHAALYARCTVEDDALLARAAHDLGVSPSPEPPVSPSDEEGE
ncbi:MAG: DUF2958 domain-containing protein [Rhodospirillaceae bacterium]|nr:DUF2958 domain-containing protein [Rhodospirillaceae bacterium]